jgi:hypothetical protein
VIDGAGHNDPVLLDGPPMLAPVERFLQRTPVLAAPDR